MTNEDAIKWLENLKQDIGQRWILKDAIALLKEQEAVKPKLVGPSMWRCGKCEALLGWEEFTRSGVELVEYKFCPECGRPVKWDA